MENTPTPCNTIHKSLMFIGLRDLYGFLYCVNTFIGAEIATERNLVLVNNLFKSKEGVANCMTDRAPVHTVLEQLLKWSKSLYGTVWT